MTTLFIDWNPSEVAFALGNFGIRWYSLCWCIGLVAVYLLEHRLFREQKVPDEKFDPLFLYCFLGILVGARLGHCIFYEPAYYLTSWQGFAEMLLPIKFTATGWRFTGYEGLASHGGTLGLILALWLYVKRTGLKFRFVLDNIAIVTPICACAIRLGNLMNSEIIGRTTDLPWAFKFHRSAQAMQTLLPDGTPIPRHPGQLYEALCYALFFFIGWWCYRNAECGMKNAELRNEECGMKNAELRNAECRMQNAELKNAELKNNTKGEANSAFCTQHSALKKHSAFRIPAVGTGFFFGLCITLIFASRILIEFTKEVQGGLDNGSLPLDMGQLLSIPFVLLGIFCMFRAKRVKVG